MDDSFDAPYDNMIRMQNYNNVQKTLKAAEEAVNNAGVTEWSEQAGLSRGLVSIKDLVVAPGQDKATPYSMGAFLAPTNPELLKSLREKTAKLLEVFIKPRYDYQVICDERNNSQEDVIKDKLFVDWSWIRGESKPIEPAHNIDKYYVAKVVAIDRENGTMTLDNGLVLKTHESRAIARDPDRFKKFKDD